MICIISQPPKSSAILFRLARSFLEGHPNAPTARAAQRLPGESNDRALLQTRDTTLQSRPPADGKIAHLVGT